MPLIRYAVGDSGIAPNGERCKCGRGFSTMGPIEGRCGDVVLTPSGNRLIVHFFTGVLEHFLEIVNFQVLQEETDRLILRVVPGEGFSRETLEEVRQGLQAQGLTDMTIDMEVVSQIPVPTSQKHRFIMSKLAVADRFQEDGARATATVPVAARSKL